MNIPGFQDIMLPLLQFAGDEKEHHIQEAYKAMSDEFNLTDEDLAEMVPSRPVPKINDRVAWARTYLVQACLLESTRRAHFRITDRGKEVLDNNPPDKIDVRFLTRYFEFREFQQRKKNNSVIAEDASVDVAEDGDSSSETTGALVTRVPDFQTMMLPLLKFMGDGEERHIEEVREELAQEFDLTENDIKELIPSGLVSRFSNRLGWARTYMTQAGLLETTRRAYFRITERGKEVLSNSPEQIDISFLEKYQEFIDFQQRKRNREIQPKGQLKILKAELTVETPDERIASAYQYHRRGIENRLLEKIRNCSPDHFEKLAIRVLSAMGYSDLGDEEHVGGPGDGGIDGIIYQDKLGIDAIYIQAKQQKGTVGRPEIHKFVGALQEFSSKKGVFVTSSTFSSEAKEYAESKPVVLVDGEQLVKFMFEYNVGVLPKITYEVKEFNPDFNLLDLDLD